MAANRVITTAGIITVAVGSVNAVAKNQSLPSSRFLIGSGVAFLILSALAEGEPELAQSLALAVCSTVVLGEGGGVLSYINGRGEIDTAKAKVKKITATPGSTGYTPASTEGQPPTSTAYENGVQNRPQITQRNPTLTYPGLTATP